MQKKKVLIQFELQKLGLNSSSNIFEMSEVSLIKHPLVVAIFLICFYITNYHKLSDLKQQNHFIYS